MISFCSLTCDTCPIHLATMEPDPVSQFSMRNEIATVIREKYGMNLNADEVGDCDGCMTQNGRLFSGCLTCAVRACAIEKGMTNCRLCDDYWCEKLKAFTESES
jgi:hypothetical protein